VSAKVIRDMKAAFAMTRQRCYNPKCRDYKFYGGRGITICQRWLDSFDNLLADMGLRPEGMTLERVENDGPYSKANCIWATRKCQAANQRTNRLLTYKGETMSVSAWAERLGIDVRTLHARIHKLGYSVEEAFSKPVKPGGLLPGKAYKKRRPPDMSNVPRGLDHPSTRFTQEQLAELRSSYAEGESFSSIARRFNTTCTTVSSAVMRRAAYKGT
jgi:hypothetical protein